MKTTQSVSGSVKLRLSCILPPLFALLVLVSSLGAREPDASAAKDRRQAAVTTGPKIWLADAQNLRVSHVAARPSAQSVTQSLAAGQGQPLSMAKGDFDADGVEDLVVGYATPAGGALTLHRGNLDAFAPQSEASFQAIGHGQFPPPFLEQARVIDVPIRPDFIAVGNFAGQGNQDLAIAARGGSTLYILANDGKGNFAAPQAVSLPGGVTALAAGSLGGGRSLTDLVLAISNSGKSSLAILGDTGVGLGALASYPLSAPASNILFGAFGDPGPDVAFLAAGQIRILRPANMQIETVSLPISVSAFALGSFIFDRKGGSQIAVLGSDGSIQIAARVDFDPRGYSPAELIAIRRAYMSHRPAPAFVPTHSFPADWKVVESFPAGGVGAGQVPLFFRTRVSNNGADDIMLLNARAGQMMVISHPITPATAQTFAPGQMSMRPYAGSPIVALPTRVNVDGRPGVLALHEGEVRPSAMMPIPDPTFFVNQFDDPAVPVNGSGVPTIAAFCNNTSNTDTSSSCSLREAIVKANMTAGADTIMLAAGTYTLTRGRIASPNYDGVEGTLNITDSVTLVGQVDGSGNPTSIITWGTLTSGNSVDMVLAVNEDIISPTVPNFTTADGTFSNLIIQNGVNHGTHSNDGDGGCMEFDTGLNGTSSLSLTNIILQNCATTQGGGGGLVTFDFVVRPGTGTVTISNSTFQNNSAVDSVAGTEGGGIGISAGTRATITNTIVRNNNATNVHHDPTSSQPSTGGGLALDAGGGGTNGINIVTISASTISGNTASGLGGGMTVLNSSLTLDQGTIISGNTAGTASIQNTTDGGGMYVGLPAPASCAGICPTVNFTGVTIINNHATGDGGGIFTGSGGTFPTAGPMSFSFCRLAGNTAAGIGSLAGSTAVSGSNLANEGTTVTATNNWWGTNNPGSTISTSITGATTNFDPFIVLTHTASPQTIRINQSATLTGDMSKDNHGDGAALSGNLAVIVGLPVNFNGANLGTIPQAQPEALGNPVPTATATFNAGTIGGLGSANATVDQAVVPVNSNLIASATEAGSTVTITTVGAHGFSTGQFVTISGVGVAGYNGNFFLILSAPTATTFSYTSPIAGLGASSGGTATTGIVILQPPSITKSFGGAKVTPISTPNTLTFSITNPNVVPIEADFTDTLPTIGGAHPGSLLVATTPNVVNGCGGSVTATAGSATISFSNAALAASSAPCTIAVNVQSAVDGGYSNSVTINSTDAGNGNTSSDTLTVISPPSIAKSFTPTSIPQNATSSLAFTVTNSNMNSTLNGVAFTDTLPTGLTVASITATVCGGTLTTTNPTGISLTGATIASSGQCQFSVTVTGTTGGQFTNTTGNVSSTNGGTGNTATASLTVVGPPSIAKVFNPTSIALNATTSLTFTLANPNTTASLTGVGFTDTLPTGLTVASGTSTACGGALTTTAPTGVSLTGATIAATGTCQFSVTVAGATAGSFTNTTGAVTSNEGGTGNTATATLTVLAPPSIAKSFNPASIALNATTSLTFTITNPAANTAALAGVAFTDTLPTGLTVASGTSTVCGGTLNTTNPTGISLTGATVAANGQCQFSVTVTDATAGQFTNTTGAVSSTNGGTGNTATANLTVIAPPSVAKSFNPNTIAQNATTSLQFTIANPTTNTVALAGVAFTDTLPTGLTVASSTATVCGGTLTTANPTGISLAGATVAAGGQCQFSVTVTAAASGQFTNTTGAVTSTNGGTGNTASASLSVTSPPSIVEAFNPNSIALNTTTSLTFTIANPNTTVSLTGVGFTDVLPTGLTVASGTSTVCAGTLTTTAPTGISLTGATITAGGQCQFSVTVTGPAVAGSFTDTTGAVSSTNGGTGNTATATLTVIAPPAIAKTFTPAGIQPNGVSTLMVTISNPPSNTAALAGVAFTDSLPANIVVATPNGLTSTCGGTPTATSGSGTLSLTGGSIAVNSSCTVSVNVTGSFTGSYLNTTGPVSSTNGGTGGTASATLFIANPPFISKLFLPNSTPATVPVLLSFTITNPNSNSTPPNNDVTLTGISFTDALPAGLVVASPNLVSNSCGGVLTATPGSSALSLTGGSLGPAVGLVVRRNAAGQAQRARPGLQPQVAPAADGNCFVSVEVVASTVETANNTTGAISANESGPGATSNTAALTVTAAPVAPTVSKAFGASSIPLNGTTSLSFTFGNPNLSTQLNNVSLTDSLPSGLIVATPSGVSGTCVTSDGASVAAVPGSSSVGITAITLPPAGSCSASVNVVGTAAGAKNNTTSAVTATFTGNSNNNLNLTGGTGSASLAVVAPPSLAKTFTPTLIAPNGTSALSFTVAVPSANSVSDTGVAFTDTFPNGLLVATPNGLTGSCGGGTIIATAGSSSVSLAGASLAPGASCTFSVNVTSAIAGIFNNSATINSTNGGAGNIATSTLTVAAPLTFTKTFGASSVGLATSTSLTFTINNPNATLALSSVVFTDPLPSGLVVATPNGLTGTCGSGTVTATAGSSSVSLTGGTIAAGSSCIFSVNITAIAPGNQVNTTSTVSSNAGTGNSATASINVPAPDLSIQKSHSGNFFQGQAGATYTITVSNVGQGPTAGTVTVNEMPPAGLTVTSIIGTGWSCTISLTCTRTDALAAGSSYPAITVTVSVATNAATSVTNTATVSGGGELNLANDTATDITTITAPPDFTLAFSPTMITIRAGQTATYGVTISPTNNAFANAINLAATGVPPKTQFGFTPSSVTPGASPATSTLTVMTTGGDPFLAQNSGKNRAPLFAIFLPIAGLLLSGLGLRKQAWRKGKGAWMLLAVMVACCGFVLNGCGSAQNFRNFGTPPGTYTITVTATSGGTQHSVPITLTVQP